MIFQKFHDRLEPRVSIILHYWQLLLMSRVCLYVCRSLTFGVVERVHVSVDVALQVGMKAGCGGKEGQADGHQLPASLQAVIAEILCSLTTQLNVKLITQTLVAPPTHHHLTETGREQVTQGVWLFFFSW